VAGGLCAQRDVLRCWSRRRSGRLSPLPDPPSARWRAARAHEVLLAAAVGILALVHLAPALLATGNGSASSLSPQLADGPRGLVPLATGIEVG
jgi:hypothetical protein